MDQIEMETLIRNIDARTTRIEITRRHFNACAERIEQSVKVIA